MNMKRTIVISLLTLTVLVLLGSNLAAARQSGQVQSEIKPAPTPSYPLAPLRRDFKNSFPIPTGEKLEYEVRFSRFPIFNATVGIVTFENLGAVANPPAAVTQTTNGQKESEPLIKGLNVEYSPAPDEQLLHLRATAVSKGWLIAILGVDVRDRFETLVDMRDFSARLSFKETKEGKKHTMRSALFERADQQVKYLTTDLNKPDAPPTAKSLARQDGMLSLLSAFYFVRLQKLKEGQMLSFPVSYDEENYQFEILVGKREKLKTDCGQVKTVRIEPKLFGPGRLFTRQGEMTMWMSDDDKHIPLRLVAKSSAGTVTAKLLNFKKNCNIIEQEDEKTEKAKKGK
jgi:hypothetical protein